MDYEFDLFGQPIAEPEDGRGRPAHEPTEEMFNKISRLKAAGMTHEQIAQAVQLSENTVRKYYLRALENGAALAKAELIGHLWESAERGVVGAIRTLREILDAGEAAPPMPKGGSALTPEKVEKLGKKAQLIEDAKNVPEDWDRLLNKDSSPVN
ncbi:MAG: helix-turn-helix domain-containing protein [Pseudomonadota bacterium]